MKELQLNKGMVAQADIKCNGMVYHIGNYKDLIQAVIDRDKKAKELFGEFANLNFK